jgi:hypothetical protein
LNLTFKTGNNAHFRRKSIVYSLVLLFMLCFILPANAQESPPKKSQYEKRQERRLKKQLNKSRRGDKATSNRAKLREVNYKARTRQGDRAKTTDPSGRKVRTVGTDSSPARGRAVYSQPNPYAGRRLQKTDRAATTNRRIVGSSPRVTQNAWRGDVSGRRISSTRSASSSVKSQNIYSQKGPFVNNPSSEPSRQSRIVSNQRQLKRLRGLQSSSSSSLTSRKVNPRSGSSASSAKNIYPQRGPYVNNPSPRPSDSPRVFSNSGQLKNIRSSQSQSGPPGGRKKIVPRSLTAKTSRRNIFSQSGPMVNNPSSSPSTTPRIFSNAGQLKSVRTSQPQSGPPGGRKKIVPRSSTASASGRNIFSQTGPLVRNPSPEPRSTQQAQSNQAKLARLKNLQSQPTPSTARKVVPRTASSSFIVRRKVRPYVGKFSKGEKAFTKDISGRPLRQKNYESPKLDFIPSTDPYLGRKQMGDQAYKGTMKSGHKSATRISPRAWQGDISGRKIRSPQPIDKQVTGTALKTSSPIMAKGFANFQGSMKAKKPAVGGGSLSGSWNNAGKAIAVRKPSSTAARVDIYRGDKSFSPTGVTKQGGDYQGNIRTKKPEKGGGSISGSWNNEGKAIAVRKPSGSAARVDLYRGDKSFSPTGVTNQGGDYQGNIRTKKPEKGGGSISASWNNDGKAIEAKKPSKIAYQTASFKGNTRAKDLKPVMQKQGGDFAGNMKVKKPITDDPVARWKGDKKYSELITGYNESYNFYRGYLRQPSYVKQPNSADGALKVIKPNKGINAVAGLQVKTKLPSNYARKPHASTDALKGIQASKYQQQGNVYRGFIAQPKYINNPNSDKEALKVIAPAKVNYRIADYQGNIKMQRNKTPNLHPDARFAQSGKSNSSYGRDTITGFKLVWSKLFHKNSTVPSNLKEKYERPRYDKREIGLWYD